MALRPFLFTPMSISPLSLTTGGLYPNLPNYAPLLAGGSSVLLNPTPAFNPTEKPGNYNLNKLGLNPQQYSDLTSIATLKNPDGTIVVPDGNGFVALGNGYTMGFDPDTLQGQITPLLNPQENNDLLAQTFTGADVRLMIESQVQGSDGKRYAKQLLESTTITVSIHRELAPVRAGGYINPKGFAIGKRTIAGTLIITQFTVDALLQFLQDVMQIDYSKDMTFNKIDQLPPFNITMLFTNEHGYASQRVLYGVKFVTDGVVYSIQDMMVEQTMSFMALDFSPLTPVTLNKLYTPSDQYNQASRRERSPLDLMTQAS